MSSVHEMSRVDLELSSELIESPINPAFLHMSTPLKGYDPMFHLQINGEALWQWRDIKRPHQIFDVLQFNLYPIGYQLSSSCQNRVGLNIYGRMQYVTKKVRNANGKKCRNNVPSDLKRGRLLFASSAWISKSRSSKRANPTLKYKRVTRASHSPFGYAF